MKKTKTKIQDEKGLRQELNIKYELLGIKKQPVGNRENWIDGDIKMIKSLQKKKFYP